MNTAVKFSDLAVGQTFTWGNCERVWKKTTDEYGQYTDEKSVSFHYNAIGRPPYSRSVGQIGDGTLIVPVYLDEEIVP